jgi:8-oxoguanine deaminase
MRLWIRDPLACLADNASGGLVIEEGKIAELVASGARPVGPVDETFDAGRHVVLPGLVNAHHHMYQTLTRAHPQAINKELFPWLRTLYGYWSRLTPEAHRLATRLALTELLMSGCTTAFDHHYLFPQGCEEAIDVQVDEARKLGLRMVVSRGSMDLSERDGGLPPDSVVQDRDTILADSERVIGRYHEKGTGAMIQIALAPCTPFTVTRGLMAETAALARRHGCRLHTHIAETRDETDYCEARFSAAARWTIWSRPGGSAKTYGSPMAFTSPMTRSAVSAIIGLPSATVRPRTWSSLPATAALATSRKRAWRWALVSTARPRTTIPT